MGKIHCAGKVIGTLSETPRQLEVTWRRRLTRPFIFGWLVALDSVFQSISGRLQESEKEKRQRREKMSKQSSPAPTTSTIGPCPYYYPN